MLKREKKPAERMLVCAEQRQISQAAYSQTFRIWQTSVKHPLLCACVSKFALEKTLLYLDKCSHGDEQ
jgi:hypothetical protein